MISHASADFDGAASVSRISLVLMLSMLLAGKRAVAQMPTPVANAPAAQLVPSGTTSALTLQQAEPIALGNNPQLTIGKLHAPVPHPFVRYQPAARPPNYYATLTSDDYHP